MRKGRLYLYRNRRVNGIETRIALLAPAPRCTRIVVSERAPESALPYLDEPANARPLRTEPA